MLRFVKTVFSFFLPLIPSSYLLAQQPMDSVHLTREVIVVAKPYTEVIPFQKLSGIRLEKMNSHSVADALRYFSGVQLKDYGGIGGLKTVNVRSMGSQHLGVFYDGIRLGNAQNGIVDLGKFSLDDISEITLHNGQKSEIFMSAREFASSNTIYMRSKKPVFEEGRNTNVAFRFKTGSIHLLNPSFRIEQKITDKIATSLSSEYVKSDGKYKFRLKRVFPDKMVAYDTTGIRQNGDIEVFRIENGFNGRFADGFWETHAYFYSSERGIPGAIIKNKFEYGQRLKDRNFFLQASATKLINDKYRSSLKAKFAYDYTNYLESDTISNKYKYIQKEVYLSWSNLYTVNHFWDVSGAVDYQWTQMAGYSYPHRYSLFPVVATSLDLDKFKIQANVLAVIATSDSRANTDKTNYSKVTPTLIFGYKPMWEYDFNIRAFYKETYRLPTFNELYYNTFVDISSRVPRISPEYARQGNLGFSFNKDLKHPNVNSIHAQLDVYYAQIKDKIVATPTTNLFSWMIQNLGEVRTRGVNLSVSNQLSFGKVQVNTFLTYSYDKAQDYSDPNESYYKDQIPYTPWHSGSITFNSMYRSWGLNYSFIYKGESYDANMDNIAVNRLQPWYTHDMSLQKEFTIKRHKMKTSVEVNNMFDQQYDVVRNYPMPGRNFKFIISVDL